MTITHMLVHTVTVITNAKTGEDRYGGDVIAETSRTDVTGWMAPRQSADLSTPAPWGAEVDWVLFLDPGVTVDRLTTYEWDGRTFTTEGVPFNAPMPRGSQVHHIEVGLKEVQGA